MSADLLREAAAKMRERAKAAKVWDGYWLVHPDWPGRVIEDKHGNGWDDAIIASCVDYGSTENGHEQAAYIASWHPAVALAVADWLEFVGRRHGPVFVDRDTEPSCNFVGCYENAMAFPCDDHLAALAVARTYLGRADA